MVRRQRRRRRRPQLRRLTRPRRPLMPQKTGSRARRYRHLRSQSPESYGPTLRVDDLVAPNANPIMRAAGPLLQLLGRLRVALLRASFAGLMEQVAEAIKFFEKDIRSAGISEQQANNAKYILCATADDIVQHIPTEERHVWTQYSMLSRFFGERTGGVRFFDCSTAQSSTRYSIIRCWSCTTLASHSAFRASIAPRAAALPRFSKFSAISTRPCDGSVRRLRKISRRTGEVRIWASVSRVTRVPVWAVGALAAALLFGAVRDPASSARR